MKTSGGSILWPAVGLGALIWLMSLAYGFQYLFVESNHVLYFRLFTLPFVGVVAALTWLAMGRAATDPLHASAPWWLGLLMMSISFGLASFFYSAQLAPLPWPLLGLGLPVVAYLSYRRWGYRGANVVFLVGATSTYLYLLTKFPYDAVGDMLQIIGFASQDFLAGQNPYQPYLTSSGKEVPFGYWPGIWLPYAIFVALGVDMRVLNVLALALLVLLFDLAPKDRPSAPDTTALTFYPFILSSPVWQMMLSGHLWLYWVLLCVTMFLIVRERLGSAALMFGLALACRPTALWLVGPIAAYVGTRYGLARTVKTAAISMAIAGFVNVVVGMWYGQAFWDYSYARMVGFAQKLVHFSLAGYLQDISLLWLGKPIQSLIILGAIAVLIARKRITPPGFVLLSGITYVWVVLFNTYATRYVYFPGFLLMSLGLTLASASQTQQRA